MAVVSLGNYLKSFYEEEKKSLLKNYPGLNLHRLKQEIKLHAFLNGIDSEELFNFPYLPYRSHPLTLFIKKLKEGVPLQYITGYAYFYNAHFKVTPDVLIPRNETEILVELALNEIEKNYQNKECKILDVGTGSGVIALTLMMESRVRLDVVACDISSKALAVAKENYFNLFYAMNPKHQINFCESDRFENISGKFDFILSNPPYIKKISDRSSVHHQVVEYEPELALFIDDEIYDTWFNELFMGIHKRLNDDGTAIIEGHEDHLEHLASLANQLGFNRIQVIKDYTSRNRFLNLRK